MISVKNDTSLLGRIIASKFLDLPCGMSKIILIITALFYCKLDIILDLILLCCSHIWKLPLPGRVICLAFQHSFFRWCRWSHFEWAPSLEERTKLVITSVGLGSIQIWCQQQAGEGGRQLLQKQTKVVISCVSVTVTRRQSGWGGPKTLWVLWTSYMNGPSQASSSVKQEIAPSDPRY